MAIAVVLLLAAAVAVVLLLAAGNTERGTGTTANPHRPPGSKEVSLGRGAAHDYDPSGGDGEHPEQAAAALDRDPNTSWSTESYRDGLQKDGVGLYVDAKPRVAATRMAIRTPTPGWKGAVYVAAEGPPENIDDPGWKKVATIDGATSTTSVDLDTAGQAYRYYLVWITDLAENNRVQLAEIELFRAAR